MKSPITGKEMVLTKEKRSMTFRKETFEIVFHCYKCEDSGEQFTTTALDEVNINQVYHQYRDKFNIPFADEITKIRYWRNSKRRITARTRLKKSYKIRAYRQPKCPKY